MGKILLYYKYVRIEYPKRTLKWQQNLCTNLGLTGRILIGHEGINATVGGSDESIEYYKNAMRKDPLFADIDFKESTGGSECFPRMRIAIRDEIVSLGIPATDLTPEDAGTHLKPHEVHELMTAKPDDLVILDARNKLEWQVGAFTDAIKPEIDTFRELPAYIDEHADLFKDKQVVMYCTGGIRCERASAYLNKKGIAKKVYQIEGGIHRYTEQYPDGFFRGSNYVFDDRVTVKINDDMVGSCELCKTPCDRFTNCLNVQCNKHFIACQDCVTRKKNSCSDACMNLLEEKKVVSRSKFRTVPQDNYTPASSQ
jgi:predicted sulfurtransferase